MDRVWCHEESLSVPGILSSRKTEYWVKIIAIPTKWWSIKEWKKANNFLKFIMEKNDQRQFWKEKRSWNIVNIAIH